MRCWIWKGRRKEKREKKVQPRLHIPWPLLFSGVGLHDPPLSLLPFNPWTNPSFHFFLERQIFIKGFSWLSYISPRALKLLLKISMSAQRYTSYFWSMQNLSLVNSGWNFGDHQFWCIFDFHTLLFSFVSSSCLCSSPCMVFCQNSGFPSPIHMTLHIALLFLSYELAFLYCLHVSFNSNGFSQRLTPQRWNSWN